MWTDRQTDTNKLITITPSYRRALITHFTFTHYEKHESFYGLCYKCLVS